MNSSGSSISSGMRSFSRKSEDALQDWENHLLLRFPPEIAQKIREYLEDEAHSNDSRMSLSINSNLRTGTLKFDKQEMPFTLYDLPCITEVMKTLDNKTVYKVADISQMIVCSPPLGDKSRREMRTEDEDMQQKVPADYEWPNGLCPPMRNARKKRFRKVIAKKYMDAADVERELKRLLRSDLEAASVRWEVVAGDEPEKNIPAELRTESRAETFEDAGIDEYGLSLSESDEEDLA